MRVILDKQPFTVLVMFNQPIKTNLAPLAASKSEALLLCGVDNSEHG